MKESYSVMSKQVTILYQKVILYDTVSLNAPYPHHFYPDPQFYKRADQNLKKNAYQATVNGERGKKDCNILFFYI